MGQLRLAWYFAFSTLDPDPIGVHRDPARVMKSCRMQQRTSHEMSMVRPVLAVVAILIAFAPTAFA